MLPLFWKMENTVVNTRQLIRYFNMKNKVKKLRKKLRNIVSKATRKADSLNFKCFIVDCSKKAINSHSQSLSNTLRRISKDGYVISPRLKRFMKQNVDIDSFFQKIHVNLASTFKGFCDVHDTKYFLSADRIYEHNITQETLAKLSFRTFAYEERIKEKNLFYLDYVIGGMDKSPALWDIPNIENFVALAGGIRNHLSVTRPYYLNKFITMFDSQNYDQIYGTLFSLNKMIPLSCSTAINPTLFSADDLIKDDFQKPLDVIFFNLIPQTDSTLVLLTYFKEQKLKVKKFLSEISSLENIVFNYCEEVLMSPDFYDSLTYEMKCKIIKGLWAWSWWEKENFPELFCVKLDSPIYMESG